MTVPAAWYRSPLTAAVVITTAFIVLYSATAGRTVTLDAKDAAEFQTVGAAGGVPHQPYPLWCILARSASLVPAGEPAFRVTFVSILFASLCVGALFVLLVRRTGELATAACASIAFGLSRTWWENAVIAEVYALNAFIIVTALLVLDRVVNAGPASRSLLFALLLGFALSGLTMNVALLPAVALVIWLARRTRRGWPSPRARVAHILVFLLPFTLYGYTYLVDRGPYPMNWLDNLGQYYAQQRGVTAEEFARFENRMWLQMWPARLHPEAPTVASVTMNLRRWTRQVVDAEYPFAGALLVLTGFIMLWRRDVRASAFLAVIAGSYLILVLVNIAGELLAHSIPIYMLCALYIAAALSGLRRWTVASRRAGVLLYAAAAAAIVVMPLLRHLKASPFSKALRSPEQVAFAESAPGAFVHLRAGSRDGPIYAAAVERAVPPNSLIFAGWAEANVLLYYKLVLGELEHVEVQYLLPTPEQVTGIIKRTNPAMTYFTRLPEAGGLEPFQVRDTVTVLPPRGVRPARKLYAVAPP